jgi:outer membrane receptor for monomeric catechols
MEDNMSAGMLRTVAITIVAVCFADAAFAVDGVRLRHTARSIPGSLSSSRSQDTAEDTAHDTARTVWRATGWKQKAVRTAAGDRDPYVDPAAPYKANRLSSPASRSILDTPGQVTVLTRQVLDDKNATTLKDALGSTAGVTVGR